MNILTPSGYKDVTNISVGDEVVAFDIVTGKKIVNILSKKQLFYEKNQPEKYYIINGEWYKLNDVFRRNGDSVYTFEVKIGDLLYYKYDQPFLVDSVEEIIPEAEKPFGDFTHYCINNELTIFKNESIWVNGNVTHAYKLKKGDVIYDKDGNEVKVVSVEKIDNTIDTWWNISIKSTTDIDNHNFIVDGFILHNASRYLVAGGTGNWNSTTNWSATSGGASGASFPVSTDDAIIDTNSANQNITVNTNSACLTLNISNYTGTWTQSQTLTVSGSVTLASGMTVAGSGALTINAASTITSNGKTWSPNLTFSGSTYTVTLSGDFTLTGTLTLSNSNAQTLTINGDDLYIGGSITQTGTNAVITGSTDFMYNGTGTWTASTSQQIRNNFTINTAGTLTIGTINYGDGTFTYVAGTIVAGDISIRGSGGGTTTLNCSGMSFNNFTMVTSGTLALSSNLTINTSLQLDVSTTFTGTGVWTTPILTIGSASNLGRTIILVSGQTYTVTSSISCIRSTNSSRAVIQSSTGGVKANLTLGASVTQNNIYLDVTDIDSSGGVTGVTVNGTLTSTTNWIVASTNPMQFASTFTS